MDASLASLRQGANAGSNSRSPITKARGLANKFNIMKSSWTSSNDDNIWTAKTSYAWDTRLLFKRRITNLYISITSLRSYVEINYSGFRKILKK